MTARRAVVPLAVLIAVALVLGFYYWVHKPVTPLQALAVAETVANLAVALLVAALCGATGRWLLRLWVGGALAGLPIGAQAALAFALGCGALGLAWLALGMLGLLYPLVAWLSAAILLIVLRGDLRAWLAGTTQAVRQLVPVGRAERLAALFVALVLALGLLSALAPPVTWDALVYHLTLPAFYMRTHGLRVNTANFHLFSGMPELTEMLYTLAGLLRVDAGGGGIAAQALGWVFGAMLGLGLAAQADELGLPAWFAPAILFSSISVALELSWAYVDLLLMLMALAVMLALRQWQRARDAQAPAGRWLALGGVFAGLACGCKYTGVIIPLAGVAVVVVGALVNGAPGRTGRLVRALRSSLAFGLAAGAAFAPWLLKNWYFTGNPFYPLIFPAADMDALSLWFYNRPDLAMHPWAALTIFVRATILGVQSSNSFDATLGPLLLLCVLLLIFDWRVLGPALRNALWPWLLFVAGAYLGWVALAQYSALAQQSRLFFALLPALALVGAAGLAGLRGLNLPTLRLSIIVNAVFVLVLGLSAVELIVAFVSHDPLPYLAGVQSAADFEAAALGPYAPALSGVDALPSGSRVLFLWETRSYGCLPTIVCVPDVVIDRWWHDRRTLGDAEQILGRWRAEGTNYVLVYDVGARFIQDSADNGFDPSDWTELDRLRSLLRPVATYGNAYTLYAVP